MDYIPPSEAEAAAANCFPLLSFPGTDKALKNDKDWTVQNRLLSARRASQMAVFDNDIERWGEVDVPYLPSQLIGSYSNE
ncbi:hypothetical protein J6590_085942 [Homalodisca vitripennis]|nr:hypothetical protein J6590_085942 [Homalodisca vitripennis]